MLNFLLDIAPDKSQLLLTIKLAGILREKKQEVYYTYTSNPAFTPVLYAEFNLQMQQNSD